MRWKTWFGVIEKTNDEVKLVKSRDFVESFLNSSNDPNTLPIPFSIKDVGLSLFKNEKEYYATLRDLAIKLTEEKIKQELSKDDKYVIMLLKTLDALNEVINVLSEKLRDLKNIKITDICSELDSRINDLTKLRKNVELEIKKIMERIAPNLTNIVGASIAARLLEKAGSLEKLAKMPASTIQLLGAEKSLYKAISRIKKGKPAKIPKHGVIFQHPFIRFLPKRKRGKMARFLASKIAIAVKLDYFSCEKRLDLFKVIKNKYESLRRL